MNLTKKILLDKLKNYNESMIDLLREADEEDFEFIKTLVEELDHELDEIEFANDYEDLIDD